VSIRILCVGRLKDGPERDLVDDYIARAKKLGRQLGWRDVAEIEVEAGGGRDKEGERLLAKQDGARLIRLDERGEALTSQAFSRKLATWRDNGESVAFLIGGADGHGANLATQAPQAIAFGVQTWPHKMVRVMLAEQIYRALSIEAGTPYHRE
jgi:23S rRNA (pseudouridine1915-N3)-methyltransferase